MCVLLCLPHKPQFMGIPHLILLVLFGSTQFNVVTLVIIIYWLYQLDPHAVGKSCFLYGAYT